MCARKHESHGVVLGLCLPIVASFLYTFSFQSLHSKLPQHEFWSTT